MFDPSNDVLIQYCNASNKLKKRFLRKPNVTEAGDAFSTLGQQCENYELPSLSGLCWNAAAKCEASVGNLAGETSCLIRSGRQFLASEEYDRKLGCVSVFGENLQAAIGCFSQASNRYPPKSPLSVNLNLEMIEYLKKIGKNEYIDSFLNNGIQLAEDMTDTKIFYLNLLASNYIEKGDYVAALDTFTEIDNLVSSLPTNGARAEILQKCEVSRVFLLLILRPTPQKLSPSFAKLLEKYTWGDNKDKILKACGMTEKLFILLQSLVIVCQSNDFTGLPELEAEFWDILCNEEKSLLRMLVKTYCS